MEIKSRLQEILTELCEWLYIDIVEAAIASEHVYMYLSVSPKYAPAHVMKVIKGSVIEQQEDQLRLWKDSSE
jgi:REP element-mobilizing transposase RayT